MTAIGALSAPPSREAQLAKARERARRWINAMPPSERGPLWDVLSNACDDAEILGLNDHSFETFVKNAMRYIEYLALEPIDQARAFDKQMVRGYQRYVASLRKTKSVPPPQEGKPATWKPKPTRRAAKGNEPRLKIKTQKDILDAIRLLFIAATDQDAHAFPEIPTIPIANPDLAQILSQLSPTAALKWRKEEETDPERIELDLAAMLSPVFKPARGRSRCDFERNLVLAHFYCAIPTRNAELREAIWEGLQVWEIAPNTAVPLRRWPIEALLTGEVALDETHVLFLTLGGAVPTKSNTYRSVPIVGALAKRVQTYARLWVENQLETLKYLRYRARKRLDGMQRSASFDLRAVELLIDGTTLSVHVLEQNVALFTGACDVSGPGLLKWDNSILQLTAAQAEAFRDLLWAEAASARYSAALIAFDTKTPVRDVFAGVFLPSRKGGALCDKQMQFIWREMGWTAKGWTAQHLRAHAAQLFEAARLEALRPLGSVIGHKEPTTTALNYTGDSPYRDVVVAETIAAALEREPFPRYDEPTGTRRPLRCRASTIARRSLPRVRSGLERLEVG